MDDYENNNQSVQFLVGHVSAYDPNTHSAVVEFPELDITSGWLPVLVRNSKDNQDTHHLDIGEHVFCLTCDNTGFVLGSFYDAKNLPKNSNRNIRSVTFSDGTKVTYDRQKHITELSDTNGNLIHLDDKGITITSCADISFKANGNYDISASSNITLKGSNIYLN